MKGNLIGFLLSDYIAGDLDDEICPLQGLSGILQTVFFHGNEINIPIEG